MKEIRFSWYDHLKKHGFSRLRQNKKYHSEDICYCVNNSLVITSDITFIVPFSMICDSDNRTTTEAGSSENRSWLTRHPPHNPTSQTGMLLLMHSTESVEVLITVMELWAGKVDETTGPLCSTKEDRRRRRGGSKWQKCCRATIREPLAKCEGSPATSWALLCNLNYFVRTSQPAATAALTAIGLRSTMKVP